LKRRDSAKEIKGFYLDFVALDLEIVAPGLDFVVKNLDFGAEDLDFHHRARFSGPQRVSGKRLFVKARLLVV
jgi:hypothetical protein